MGSRVTGLVFLLLCACGCDGADSVSIPSTGQWSCQAEIQQFVGGNPIATLNEPDQTVTAANEFDAETACIAKLANAVTFQQLVNPGTNWKGECSCQAAKTTQAASPVKSLNLPLGPTR